MSYASGESLQIAIQILILLLLFLTGSGGEGSAAHWHFSQKSSGPVVKISASVLLTLRIVVGWPLLAHISTHLKTYSFEDQ